MQPQRGPGRQGQRAECRRALDELGYRYWDETDNPAYALFLGTRPATGEA